MSNDDDPKSKHNPDGTFKKGFTANRKGAPPKARRKRPETAFDVLLEEEFNPFAKDLPEGLTPIHEGAWRTFVAALKENSKRARRTALKHIQRRDTERIRLFNLNEPTPHVKVLLEPLDTKNIDEALLILGITREDAGCGTCKRQATTPQAIAMGRSGGTWPQAWWRAADSGRYSQDPVGYIRSRQYPMAARLRRFDKENQVTAQGPTIARFHKSRTNQLKADIGVERSASFDAVLSLPLSIARDEPTHNTSRQ
jgi:hypothetical protein